MENNSIYVKTGADELTVWLSPEMVDFKQAVTLSASKGYRGRVVKPHLETMLEDARTRGDRQHPFWAKLTVGQK